MIKPSITDQKKKTTLIKINQGSNYEHKVVENTGRAKTEEGASTTWSSRINVDTSSSCSSRG